MRINQDPFLTPKPRLFLFAGNSHTDALTWSQLSEDERVAASSVGYSQRMWDVESYTDALSDDDNVFYVSSSNTWVSRYMIIYFAAALCFCMMGIVDWIREGRFFHVCMVLAGIFGLVSSMLVESNEVASNIFNLVSVHFFLLEGVNIIRGRIQNLSQQRQGDSHKYPGTLALQLPSAAEAAKPLWWIPKTLWAAEILFVFGALIDCILSYFYFQPLAEFNWALAKAFLFSTVLWLAAALLYSAVTISVHCCYRSEEYKRAIYGQGQSGSKTLQAYAANDEEDEEDVEDDATASILPHSAPATDRYEGKSPCIPRLIQSTLSPTETMDSASVGTKTSAYDLENISPIPKQVAQPRPNDFTHDL